MFTPRVYETILTDMLAYVRKHSELTDEEIGSIARTLLEAAALEDDEQYFQMVQLMDAFDLNTARGALLDGRLQDYDILRLQPKVASGSVIITDENLIQTTLAASYPVGSTTIVLDDSSEFPTSGYGYYVRIGEGTISVEDVSVSANNTSINTLTVSALINSHDGNVRVSYVSGDADINLNKNIGVLVPATATSNAINYVTTETGILVNGNYESTVIGIKAIVPGTVGNVSVGKVTGFTSSPPFSGAAVRNITSIEGGIGTESDSSLIARGKKQIQALSKAIKLAIIQAALGVTDSVTAQTVTTANIKESVENREVVLYIDDGTGFAADSVALGNSALDTSISAGVSSFVLQNASSFPSEGLLLISPESGQVELVEYTSINYATKTVSLSGVTVNTHDADDEVVLVELISGIDGAESNQQRFRFNNMPIIINSERIWTGGETGNSWVLKEIDTDYYLNHGIGEVELVNGLSEGARLLVTYAYYTGLIQTVQNVIEGQLTNPNLFPGVKAAGVFLRVETPVIRRISVKLSISAKSGFNENELIPLVRESVENYINNLGIGEDVILSSIIDACMNITGVYNAKIQTPLEDVVILEDELPVPFTTTGSSLVTVN